MSPKTHHDPIALYAPSILGGVRIPWAKVAGAILMIAGGVLAVLALVVSTGAASTLVVEAGTQCSGIEFGCGLVVAGLVLGVIGLVLGVAHLVAGIGLWKGRRWARPLSLIVVVPIVVLAGIAVLLEVAGRQQPLSALIAIPWTVALVAILRA